jgi:hypothetical protein
MKIVNTELFKPANIFAIVAIVAITNYIAHKVFLRHVVDERKRARFGKGSKGVKPVDPTGDSDGDGIPNAYDE